MELAFQDVLGAVMIVWIVALTAALVRSRMQIHRANVVMDYAKTYYVGKAGPAPEWVEEMMMSRLGMKRRDEIAGDRGAGPRQAKDAGAEVDGDGGGDPSAAPAEAEVGSSGTFADLCIDDAGNGGGRDKAAASGGGQARNGG